jgi:hypothetical protein
MEHVVTLDEDDVLLLKITRLPKLSITLTFDQALEAILQAELTKLHARKNDAQMAQNMGLAAQQPRNR